MKEEKGGDGKKEKKKEDKAGEKTKMKIKDWRK
jgi:hypothetical protein